VDEITPFSEVLGDELSDVCALMSFLTYEHGLSLKPTLKQRYELEEQERRNLEIKQRAEQLEVIKKKLQSYLFEHVDYLPFLQEEDKERLVRNAKIFDTLRTRKKAFVRFIELIPERVNPEGRTLIICHNNNPEDAETLKQMALDAYPLKDVRIIPMRGISTFYANVGGLVMAL